ncbi:hypothetical protein EZS27_036098 [termite gut metagenome]|uniref:Uncharacterized protein n=1 Tax=termite gut metagenome TaxID=433724 RepID=A0A5J4PVC5_9ZZZZ
MKVHFFKHVLLGLAIVAGFSAAVMLLWNIAVPSIFGLTAINFWQALVLLALVRILFGGLGSRFRDGIGIRGGGGFGKNPIREKWEKMTPEERTEFIKKRNEFGRGFGHGYGHDFFGARGFDFDNESKKENE